MRPWIRCAGEPGRDEFLDGAGERHRRIAKLTDVSRRLPVRLPRTSQQDSNDQGLGRGTEGRVGRRPALSEVLPRSTPTSGRYIWLPGTMNGTFCWMRFRRS